MIWELSAAPNMRWSKMCIRDSKQGVLGLGVGFVFRRGTVCHGKILENTAEVQLGQGGAALHGSDCRLKVRTHAEPNASHTGINLKVARCV